MASLLKCISDFIIDVFLSEKELSSLTNLLKKTSRRTEILISPVWNKISKIWGTLFESIRRIKWIKYRSTTRQKYIYKTVKSFKKQTCQISKYKTKNTFLCF